MRERPAGTGRLLKGIKLMHEQDQASRCLNASELRSLILEALYSVPEPLGTDEARERHQHLDLADMTDSQLRREGERVRWRLTFDLTPSDWLIYRLDAIDGGLADGDG